MKLKVSEFRKEFGEEKYQSLLKLQNTYRLSNKCDNYVEGAIMRKNAQRKFEKETDFVLFNFTLSITEDREDTIDIGIIE